MSYGDERGGEGRGGGTRLHAGPVWTYQIFTVYIEMLRILITLLCCLISARVLKLIATLSKPYMAIL